MFGIKKLRDKIDKQNLLIQELSVKISSLGHGVVDLDNQIENLLRRWDETNKKPVPKKRQGRPKKQ